MSEKHDPKAYKDVVDLLENTETDNTLAKERIYKRLVNKIETGNIQPQHTKKDGITMMKRKWKTAAAAVAAVVLIGGALSTTSYAQEMIQSILARFQVGNMEIVQYDKELPVPGANASAGQDRGAESGVVELPASPKLTLQEARSAIGMNFPAPSWVADFEYVNTVIHGKTMVEAQYKQGEKTVNFLISQGGENGIGTTGPVKTEVIDGTKVYFANGIVIWEEKGFTVEMYARDDFDTVTLGKIINSFAVGEPLTQEEIDKAKANWDSTVQTEKAGPAPAPAGNN
ncbi:hypothetical protein NDK47_00160 [Brevibacillus ruminantium]|uniref:DUF4367 domain-containing protein n=1 Tax=Brevibacillus ruminantium TaxID=2950604 RepID=A0ABY4WFB7_9BACL|nr:hypothetical protein [Brevibacillus ruminantium]USG65832.1 hypothetical protein NDK47_00160 [Brevibacillus ruminantium]